MISLRKLLEQIQPQQKVTADKIKQLIPSAEFEPPQYGSLRLKYHSESIDEVLKIVEKNFPVHHKTSTVYYYQDPETKVIFGVATLWQRIAI